MVKTKIEEGVFGGAEYAWKVDGIKDIWDFLFELAENIDESMDVRVIECVGEVSLDFPTDELRRYKSVSAFKDGADEAKEFTNDATYYVDMDGKSFSIGAYGDESSNSVILKCANRDEAVLKKLDKLIHKWFG